MGAKSNHFYTAVELDLHHAPRAHTVGNLPRAAIVVKHDKFYRTETREETVSVAWPFSVLG